MRATKLSDRSHKKVRAYKLKSYSIHLRKLTTLNFSDPNPDLVETDYDHTPDHGRDENGIVMKPSLSNKEPWAQTLFHHLRLIKVSIPMPREQALSSRL